MKKPIWTVALTSLALAFSLGACPLAARSCGYLHGVLAAFSCSHLISKSKAFFCTCCILRMSSGRALPDCI